MSVARQRADRRGMACLGSARRGMRIVVSPDLCGRGWHATDENYGGPPEHCGFGTTEAEAVADLLAWLDEEPGEITVVVEP